MALVLPLHRKRRPCLRQVIDAMRYICRAGCRWRSLASCLPAWSAVHDYLRRWQLSGLWQTLTDAVNQADRVAAGRPATPSLGCPDSQSIWLAPRISEQRALDGGKYVKGRKRQILNDMQERILACRVHAAHGRVGLQAGRAEERKLARCPEHLRESACKPGAQRRLKLASRRVSAGVGLRTRIPPDEPVWGSGP